MNCDETPLNHSILYQFKILSYLREISLLSSDLKNPQTISRIEHDLSNCSLIFHRIESLSSSLCLISDIWLNIDIIISVSMLLPVSNQVFRTIKSNPPILLNPLLHYLLSFIAYCDKDSTYSTNPRILCLLRILVHIHSILHKECPSSVTLANPSHP